MNQPFFSVITICYNSELTIDDTILSIKSQSFKDFEYIIVDGKSTDATCSIISNYTKYFSQLKWISEKDNGIYNAMNKGIKMASGKYIWLVNSDDWLEPDALANIYRFITDNNISNSIICGWMNLVDCNGKVQSVSKCNEATFINGVKKLKLGIAHPATVVPKAIYNQLGLFDEQYYITADVDFILRAYFNQCDFIFVDMLLSNMRNTGVSNQMSYRKYVHDWKIRYKRFSKNKVQYYKLLIDSVLKLLVRKILPNKWLYYLVQNKTRKLIK